jgi:hypothetical protein
LNTSNNDTRTSISGSSSITLATTNIRQTSLSSTMKRSFSNLSSTNLVISDHSTTTATTNIGTTGSNAKISAVSILPNSNPGNLTLALPPPPAITLNEKNKSTNTDQQQLDSTMIAQVILRPITNKNITISLSSTSSSDHTNNDNIENKDAVLARNSAKEECLYSCWIPFRPLAIKVCCMTNQNHGRSDCKTREQSLDEAQTYQHHHEPQQPPSNIEIWMGSANDNNLYFLRPEPFPPKHDDNKDSQYHYEGGTDMELKRNYNSTKSSSSSLQFIALPIHHAAFQVNAPIIAIDYSSF